MAFAVGDIVTWTSQSAGSSTAKTGRVAEVVPAGLRPDLPNCGWARAHESYIVVAGGRRYWPRVSHLAAVESAPAPTIDAADYQDACDARLVLGCMGYSHRRCKACKRNTSVRGFICWNCNYDNSATTDEE